MFPAESTVPPGWVLGLITVGCATLSGARQGFSGLNTIWAEDGQVFYQGALTSPFHAYLEPYLGYLCTAPRIVATMAALFPVSWAAAALAMADAIVIGLLAALVYRACGEHIRNPWLRAIPSVTLAACPVGQETWGAVTNLQWPMYFVAIVVLLWNPRRPMPIMIGAVTVLLATLTSPFGLLLVPVALVRIFVSGRGRGSVIALATLIGTAVQSADMAIASTRNTFSVIAPGAIMTLYDRGVTGPVLFGARYAASGQRQGAEILIAALAALMLVAASGRLREFALAALALAYSVGFFAVLMVLSGEDIGQGISGRYFVSPFLLLAFALIVMLDSVMPGGAGRRTPDVAVPARRRPADLAQFAALSVGALLTCCLVWSVTTSWNTTNNFRQHPTWSASLAGARAKCGRGVQTAQVPITPQGWYVTLTCAQLGVAGR